MFQPRFVFPVLVSIFLLAGCARSPQAKEARYLASGKAFLAKKDYSRAVLDFRNAIRAMPKDPEAYYQLGLASLEYGDFPTAIATFRKTLELNPKHPGAQLKLAQLMAATLDPGLLQQAETRLKALLAGSPGNPDALHALALTELKLGNTDEAIQNLEQVLTESPTALNSSAVLAQVKLANKDVKGAEEILRKACDSAPKSADPHVVLGSFYVSQNRLADAAAQFQQGLQINPKSGPALLELAKLLRAMGQKQLAEQNFRRLAAMGDSAYKPAYALFLFEDDRRDEAVREFERLAKENPEDRMARTRLVMAYRAVGRSTDAQNILDRALKKNSKDLDALLQRAELFLATNQLAPAEADLNQVLHLRPTSAEAHYIFAKLHQARKEPLTYRQELSETLRLNRFLIGVRVELAGVLITANDPRAALETLSEAPDYQKGLLPVIVQRNWAFWALGDMDSMRKGIDAGLAHARTADLLTQDGLWKLRGGDAVGARTALEEALKINPADLLALQTLPRTYKQKENVLALQKIKEYAAREPKSASVQEFLGTILAASGDLAHARAAFLAAKAVDPNSRATEMSLIQLDAAEGNYEEARKKLQTVLSIDSNDMTARLWLGNLEEARGNHSAALNEFRAAVRLSPTNAQALNNLAYLLIEYGNNQGDEALTYAQKAVEIAPNRPAYSDTLGWAFYHKGLYRSAVRYLELATADSGNVVWKYHLAMAYAMAGEHARSHATLTTALKLNPNLPEARAAQQVVQAR